MDDKKILNEKELETVTGGTEPGEWSIPENGLPRPNGRRLEPENTTNKEWGHEIPEPEIPEPGTYEVRGVVWGQD